MASIPLPRSEMFSTPDVDRAVHQIERERKLKVAGVFSGLVLLVAGLLGVAYLNFGQTYDGGPPRVDPTPVAHPGEVGP